MPMNLVYEVTIGVVDLPRPDRLVTWRAMFTHHPTKTVATLDDTELESLLSGMRAMILTHQHSIEVSKAVSANRRVKNKPAHSLLKT